MQDAISQKVADALALRLSGEEKSQLSNRYTDNIEAYQLYLTGRYHYARLIPPEIRTAMTFYQQAIDRDPKYALAYFGLRKRIDLLPSLLMCRRKIPFRRPRLPHRKHRQLMTPSQKHMLLSPLAWFGFRARDYTESQLGYGPF